MKRILTLALFTLAALSANAQDIAGDWQGSLKANGAELRLVHPHHQGRWWQLYWHSRQH